MVHRPDSHTPRRGRHRDTLPRPTQPPPANLYVIAGLNPRRKAAQAALYLHGVHPDGAFSADLGGSNPAAAALPTHVLRRFLAETGVPHAELTALTLAGLASLWRERTAGRRISVFLDDALSAGQVRALMPGPGPALVVVTTSRRIAWAPEDNAQVINADAT